MSRSRTHVPLQEGFLAWTMAPPEEGPSTFVSAEGQNPVSERAQPIDALNLAEAGRGHHGLEAERCSRFGKLSKRRLACCVLSCLLAMAFLTWLGFFAAKHIIAHRISVADVSLQNMFAEIHPDSQAISPRFRLFVPQRLLDVPLISFEAWVQPMVVSTYTQVDVMRHPGEKEPRRMAGLIGNVYVDGFYVKSGEDLNLGLQGKFVITSEEYLAQMVHNFIQSPTSTMELRSSASMHVRVWGWIPLYIQDVQVFYAVEVTSMDNFRAHPPTLGEILTASGQPGALRVDCTASIFNPSPVSLKIDDVLGLQVAYNWSGVKTPVGHLRSEGTKIEPGDNLVEGTLIVEQTPSNLPAIADMATAYIGGVQQGFGPSALRPFSVMLSDEGDQTATSPVMRSALKGLNLNVNFRPKPLFFVTGISCDVTVGGSILHWPPSLYHATLYVHVRNPLPAEVRIRGMKVAAYHMNLKGNLLYNFDHLVDSSQYVLPGNKETMISVELALSEVSFPDMNTLMDLVHEAAQRRITVGVDAEFLLTVMPGFEQTIPYKNDGIYGMVCYHAVLPSTPCGSAYLTSMSARLPAESGASDHVVVT